MDRCHRHPDHCGLNAILGFTQEYRAEQAMAALKRMAVPTCACGATVMCEVSARSLVPGDIMLLEAGNSCRPMPACWNPPTCGCRKPS
jgi:magnesium-transporting ATPase (P-type)